MARQACSIRLMARPGEHRYYDHIGEAGVGHALAKPFSEPRRGPRLMEVGAVLALLPPPPARILECGCGTGWLTWLLARCGYDAVGQDVSERAIELATAQPSPAGAPQPGFVSGDFEQLGYEAEFDAVVFFDSLHHAEDEERAIRAAWRALKPGACLWLPSRAPDMRRRRAPWPGSTTSPTRICRLPASSGSGGAPASPRHGCTRMPIVSAAPSTAGDSWPGWRVQCGTCCSGAAMASPCWSNPARKGRAGPPRVNPFGPAGTADATILVRRSRSRTGGLAGKRLPHDRVAVPGPLFEDRPVERFERGAAQLQRGR